MHTILCKRVQTRKEHLEKGQHRKGKERFSMSVTRHRHRDIEAAKERVRRRNHYMLRLLHVFSTPEEFLAAPASSMLF